MLAYAALANHDVDFVLIPEVPFGLDGAAGFLSCLRRRIQRHGHAVIVVAEGAGQDLVARDGARDASGNVQLADIGQLLRERIAGDFAAAGTQAAADPVEMGVQPVESPVPDVHHVVGAFPGASTYGAAWPKTPPLQIHRSA